MVDNIQYMKKGAQQMKKARINVPRSFTAFRLFLVCLLRERHLESERLIDTKVKISVIIGKANPRNAVISPYILPLTFLGHFRKHIALLRSSWKEKQLGNNIHVAKGHVISIK